MFFENLLDSFSYARRYNMSKTIEVITEAKPHTIKKFELIEKYVDEWSRKILGYEGKNGMGGSNGIIYIDCMCNSGVYYDDCKNIVEGTALRVSKLLNSIIPNYPGKKCIMFFNDLYKERMDKLKEEIALRNLTNIEIHYSDMDCNVFLKELDISKYKQYNTLLLYDPYNASIDWEAVSPYLNRWGEVIINHMVSDTTRGASLAKKEQVINRYQETYQKTISDIIEIGNDRKKLDEIIVSLIRDNINDNQKKHYIASFPFFNRNNGLVYNLIHCCSNEKGIILFKKVAWKTFGDKSSLKNTHGTEIQLTFDMDGTIDTQTDNQCYYIKDVAKYIYEKYKNQGSVALDVIYYDLDIHPIFPSDGYKNDIKKILKEDYGVSFKHSKMVFPTN